MNRECDEAKQSRAPTSTTDGIRFSFRSLSLSPSLFLHTQNQNALPYLAEVAEQHTLPVGCSRRFHGL